MLTSLRLPFLVLSLYHFSALVSASSFVSRALHCANSPNTVAGTPAPALSPRHALPLLSPRDNPPSTTWCATQSSIYISISRLAGTSRPSSTLSLALQLAYLAIGEQHLSPPAGLPLVPGTGYSFNTDWAVKVINANNHQVTWGVLAAALAALGDYVETQRQAGTGTFAIFDGGNQVGQGTIGVGSGVAAVMSAVGGA